MLRPIPSFLAALVLAAGSAVAQDKPSPDQPVPSAKAPAADAPSPQWPKSIDKKLFAKDFRGKPAPAFVVEKVLGGDKPDRKGKVVLIDFWATWCPPCRKLIPELNDFQDKFKDDLVVIGVSGEKPDVVEKFKKDQEFRYTCAIDTKERMSKALKVEGIPHVLLISTDGIVRWQGFPLSDEEPLTAEIIQQVIDADPGVKARHEKEAKAASDPKKLTPDSEQKDTSPKPENKPPR